MIMVYAKHNGTLQTVSVQSLERDEGQEQGWTSPTCMLARSLNDN